MKIIVTGASGQLGCEIASNKCFQQHQLISLNKTACDISHFDELKKQIEQHQPDWIINAAAYTAVDEAETEPQAANSVNVIGSENLAKLCQQFQIPLLHISTDYVFSGNNNTPYLETDECQPMSVYGQTKLAGEQAIQKNCEQFIILRTAWVYGNYGRNFYKTMLNLAQKKSEINIVNDQFGYPTSTLEIARVILQIIASSQQHWGIYHYTNTGKTSWFEFAKAIIKYDAKLRSYIIPKLHAVTTAEYPAAAKRPKYSVLNCDKIHQVYGVILQPWYDALIEVFQQGEHGISTT